MSLRNILKPLAGTTFRQYTQLAGSQVLAVGLSFGVTWLISRGLPVDKFGQYRFAMTFFGLGVTLLHLGLPHAVGRLVALEESDIRQREIHTAALLLVVASSLAASAVLLLSLRFGLADTLGQDESMIYWLAPCLVLPLAVNMLAAICQGGNKIKILSLSQVAPYLLIIPFTAYAIWIDRSYDLRAAILIYAASWLAVIVYTVFRVKLKWTNVRLALTAIYTENSQSGFKIYIGGIFAVASAQLITLLLAGQVEKDLYGQYTLALATATPVALAVSSVGTVIYRRSSRLRRMPRSLWLSAFILGSGLWGMFYIGIEVLLQVAFGRDYLPSGPLAKCAIASAVLTGWGDIMQRFLAAQGYGGWLCIGAIITGAVGAGTAYVLIGAWGVFGALVSSIAAASTYIGIMFLLYYWHCALVADENVVDPESKHGLSKHTSYISNSSSKLEERL